MGKKVLVVGSGGREHTLVWKLALSPDVEKIYAAPGNAGIAEQAECVAINPTDIRGLMQFVLEKGIDLTVVGPEAPLMAGIVDAFQAEGLKVFGPSARAARIEGSKVFSKNLMHKYGVPTAEYRVFERIEEAAAYTRDRMKEPGLRLVVKADGLAAGKGVVVAENQEEALEALEQAMVHKVFGSAGDRVVVEECLYGEEVSVFALVDGEEVVFLAAAQDHKRVLDYDQGPNTGGMGAYSPAPVYTPELHRVVMRDILVPTARAMVAEGIPYRGVLYAGLMVTDRGPMVLEFNARFGDPETQVVIPLMETDIFPALEAVATGNLKQAEVTFSDEACVCVVLASAGYPGSYARGHEITGLQELSPDILVFHAGTAKTADGRLVTDGGRVLGIVARRPDIKSAIDQVYKEIPKVHFEGVHYRRDIGYRALKR
ncbi:MAG: phosphoribosylamine--glycine ligase [Syntrophothermus sp.]|uniref:phosphoribosylamine--glycine ligase n=1 Tax=Syntrophothermus sp. TaxID=2736299 RepID=UPI00257C8C48|nr:phosphoribosylamine--glycine ligase [Syntrophothermus sp.]NSW82917.1 phosphoribosylamine--glycine ligase [Syntrophothermus sp.]